MKRKSLLFLIPIFCLIFFSGYINPPNEKTEKSIELKIDSVLALMTLDEKIGQLNQLSLGSGWGPLIKKEFPEEFKNLVRKGEVGSFLNLVGSKATAEFQKIAVEESRIKIPLLFGLDVIHGFKTTFPVPIAEVSTWDPELVKLSARWQAIESSAGGVHWTFAPMVDIARDPRWGRIVEGAGEDPFLGSIMSAARVKGFQGDDLSLNNTIAACAKHFAAYGFAEGGRDYNTADISERTLREIILPPFKAAVDAGAETFMASFNEIGGVPSSASKLLMTKILRDEWGFKGFVVSDWNSVGELINHGIAADLKEASMLGINAGVDMDMESRGYISHLKELVRAGKVKESVINESVKRILRVKFLLGLFDDPYRYCSEQREKEIVMSSQIQDAALNVSRSSIVLLKNDGNILPLKKDIKKLAVIGPLAESRQDPLGSWEQFGDTSDVVTVVEGIKKIASKNTEILYSKGCEIKGTDKSGFEDAVNKAKQSDVILLILGEEGHMSGEARSRSSLDLPGVQNDLAKALLETGKPVVVILMNGRPLAIDWIESSIPAIIEAWFLGIKSGDAIAQVLFGDYNPSGKLPVSFPRTTGQVPIYYNYKNTGRPGDEQNNYSSKYIDLPLTPLYPFGYGLSYTTFEISKPSLSSNTLTGNDSITATVNITNTGNYDGGEVIQLYIHDPVASVTRPVKELKGFQKVFLKKNETKEISFVIKKSDLEFYDINMDLTTEEGDFKIFVGSSSEEVKEANFKLKKI